MANDVTLVQDPEIGKSVDVAGIATNYLEDGTGKDVVLIHGSGPGVTAFANWQMVIPRLAGSFRVVAPDIVGFGYTQRPADWAYNLDSWVRHIVGFLDSVGIGKARVVGNSFGGALSLALAARHPQRVERLVLMGSAGLEFPISEGLDAVWGYRPSRETMRSMMKYFAYDPSLITPELAESRYIASTRPGFQECYEALFPAPRQRHIAALATPEEDIRAIEAEVLIVHGRDDRIIPWDVSRRLHEILPRSQLHVFGQCGHWTQVEMNARFCRQVHDFFSE